MPTLYVLDGPDRGRTYAAIKGPAIIGRAASDVPLTDDRASRRHAEIRRIDDTWVLCDLGSSNGTLLNGQRISGSAALKDGDLIKVGSTLLVFTDETPVERFLGAQAIEDRVDLNLHQQTPGSSILAAVETSAESMVRPRPEAAEAVVAWAVVYQIAELIGTTTSVEAFLERVTEIIVRNLEVDRLVLLVYAQRGEGMELVPQVVRCRSTERERRPKIVTSHTIIQHVVDRKEGVLCANAMTDDRFGAEDPHDSIHRFQLQSIICVPIIAHDQIHGIIYLDCSMSHHTYSAEQLRLMVAVGRLTGMAFENARLLDSRVRTERLAAAGETAAYLSHHIRNILQGLQGGVEVVELGFRKADVGTARSGWEIVRRNLDRIYQSALNMLTFSKKREPRIELTSLNAIAEEVIALVQRQAEERSVKVEARLADIPEVPLDAEGMHQVVHNLLLNSVEAVAAGAGRVVVQTACDGEAKRVVLSVIDNGPGIEPEALETIFRPFQSTKGHRGTGLGLAAARKIVEELHGKLEIESTSGDGTTFTVTLPLHSADWVGPDDDTRRDLS